MTGAGGVQTLPRNDGGSNFCNLQTQDQDTLSVPGVVDGSILVASTWKENMLRTLADVMLRHRSRSKELECKQTKKT